MTLAAIRPSSTGMEMYGGNGESYEDFGWFLIGIAICFLLWQMFRAK